ncbi:MAG: Bax inhibitor-1/YccA family protein [Thermodesulfobacteriota bacterium]
MKDPVLVRETGQARTVVNSFIQSVYNWMAIGLALTGFMSYYVAGIIENMIVSNPAALQSIQPVFFILIIAELGLVFYLSARIQKIESGTATALFIIYAILNGVTLSFIFMAYTLSSIASTFFICAATFGACSVYGMVTKKDLTGVGQFMFMGLIGIIIASLVNIFLKSAGMSMIISYIGVFVFVGLTAYDTQKLKIMALSQPDGLDAAVVRKGAIMGALSLYLDFINMFLFLLRIFGTSRD